MERKSYIEKFNTEDSCKNMGTGAFQCGMFAFHRNDFNW